MEKTEETGFTTKPEKKKEKPPLESKAEQHTRLTRQNEA